MGSVNVPPSHLRSGKRWVKQWLELAGLIAQPSNSGARRRPPAACMQAASPCASELYQRALGPLDTQADARADLHRRVNDRPVWVMPRRRLGSGCGWMWLGRKDSNLQPSDPE